MGGTASHMEDHKRLLEQSASAILLLKIRELKVDEARLQTKLDQETEKYKLLSEEHALRCSDLQNSRKTEEHLMKENNKIEIQRNALQSEKEEAIGKIAALKTDQAHMASQIGSLTAQCAALTNKLEEQNSKTSDLLFRSCDLEKDLKHTQEQNIQLEEKARDLDHRLKLKESEHNRGNVENAKLEEKIHSLEQTNQQLTSAFDKEKRNQRSILDSQQQKLSDLECELCGLKVTAEERGKKVANLQAENNKLSTRLKERKEYSNEILEKLATTVVHRHQMPCLEMCRDTQDSFDRNSSYYPQLHNEATAIMDDQQLVRPTGTDFTESYLQPGQQTPWAAQGEGQSNFNVQTRQRQTGNSQGIQMQQAFHLKGNPQDGGTRSETLPFPQNCSDEPKTSVKVRNQ